MARRRRRIFCSPAAGAGGVCMWGSYQNVACGAQCAALAVVVRAWWLRLSLLEEDGVGVCFRSAVCLTSNGSTARTTPFNDHNKGRAAMQPLARPPPHHRDRGAAPARRRATPLCKKTRGGEINT